MTAKPEAKDFAKKIGINNILPNGPFFPQTNIFLSLKGQT